MIPSTLACLLALPLLSHAAARPKNAILLSEVQSVTLRGNGAMTSHRRVPAMPQLKCISNKAVCGLFEPDVMRCTNQGSSYGDEDIQWSCTASMPEFFKLGSTDVVCEGYLSPDDPYVLKGSCGVEYRLILTDKGHQRYPDISDGSPWSDRTGSGAGATLFGVIFMCVLVWILYSACCAAQNQQRPQRRRPGFGGGGGGWNPGWGPDSDDPPPPYPGTKPADSHQQGWQPGFWSGVAGGAAAGGAAGYYAGGRNQNRNNYGSVEGNGGWGSTSNGRSSSSSSGGSARYESTGFGSTGRR